MYGGVAFALNIIISNTSDKPIYQQIADQIKDHIMTAHWRS